jgi:hypothetical protein
LHRGCKTRFVAQHFHQKVLGIFFVATALWALARVAEEPGIKCRFSEININPKRPAGPWMQG